MHMHIYSDTRIYQEHKRHSQQPHRKLTPANIPNNVNKKLNFIGYLSTGSKASAEGLWGNPWVTVRRKAKSSFCRSLLASLSIRVPGLRNLNMVGVDCWPGRAELSQRANAQFNVFLFILRRIRCHECYQYFWDIRLQVYTCQLFQPPTFRLVEPS